MNPYRIIVAILFALSFSYVPAISAAEASASVASSKWEYKDISYPIHGSLEESLNAYGREGWEVVAVVFIPTQERFRIILKRAK